jgi:hypothetical protein
MPSETSAAPDHAATLLRVLRAFEQQPEAAREALKRWNRADPSQLALVAVRHLGRNPAGPAERYLSRMLGVGGTGVRCLLLPDVLPLTEALAAARILCENDFEFCRRLTEACDQINTPEAVTRTFDIVSALNRVAVVVPWLQRMTRHADPHVQSKASLIFCRLYANPLLVERQLTSPDDRVRANAVEALWNVDTPATRNILDKAVKDKHHRVAINALFGLWLLRVPGTAERMIAMASSGSPQYRAAVAWAMGQSGELMFEAHLHALASDPAESVRNAARLALQRMHCDAGEPPQVNETAVMCERRERCL